MKPYKESDLYQLISSTIQEVGIHIQVEKDHSGINMSYNFITNIVSFDANRLVKAAEELHPLVPFEIYVKTITLHELGHALDRAALQLSLDRTLEFFAMRERNSPQEIYQNPELLSMIIEEHKMNIAFEETAWDNAEKLNDILNMVDKKTFELIKKHSMSSYLHNYQEDLSVFTALQETKTLQEA